MSGQPAASPEARVRAAAALTAKAGTARLVTAMCLQSVPDPEDVTGAGLADLSQQRSMLVASLVSLRTAKRSGLERGGRFARGLLAVLRGPADVAYVAGRRYFRVADGPWREPEGKPVGLLDLSDPLWWLAMPAAAAQDVVELGEEHVHGVSTTRYRLTIEQWSPATTAVWSNPSGGACARCSCASEQSGDATCRPRCGRTTTDVSGA